ncbi:MAG: hypothetical protein KDD47_15460, partial [Acidobacteria bacterium]|nr:hypothetical protein [Acidobacteriota bacterium]
GCEQCLEQAAELHHASHRPVAGEHRSFDPTQYGDAVTSALQASLEAHGTANEERAEAPQLLEELERFPAERRQIVICNRRRFHHYGLCELLLLRSKGHWFSSPSSARDEAELAVAVAENLEPGRHDARVLADIKARAWAYLGNANRILSDFRTAEADFCNAVDHLEQGTGNPEEVALLGELRIALRLAQRRFEEVEALIDEVAQIYRQIGDTHLLGRILIRKGICNIEQGNWEPAGRFLRQGLRLVDSYRDLRLHLIGRQNLLYCLVEQGRLDEARELLLELRPSFSQLGDSLTLVRLRWLEGKIALQEGDYAAAELHLNETRQRYLDEGIGYDTALVSLDLAQVYAAQGRASELKVLAAALVPIFQSRDIHEEALAALVLFHQAAESEAVTRTLVGQLSRFLEKARSEPGLKFKAEGSPKSIR